MTPSSTGKISDYVAIVSGSSGFLGRALCLALSSEGASVVSLDLRCLRDENITSRLDQRKISVFFHMAGMADGAACRERPHEAFESNVTLTARVLEFCRRVGIKTFVLPSTGLLYRNGLDGPACETDPVSTSDIYTATKLACEALVEGYSRSFGIRGFIVRLANIYGPQAHPDTVVPTIMSQALREGCVRVRDFSPVRDFLHLEDATDGFLSLLDLREAAESFVVNLSSGVGHSIREVAETVCRLKSIPLDRIKQEGPTFSASSRVILDNSLLRRITNWSPKYDLTAGLSQLLKEQELHERTA